MTRHSLSILLLCFPTAMLAALFSPVPCAADLIRLKSGGEIRGKLLSTGKNLPAQVSVRTVTGALVTVPQEQIEFVTRRSLNYEEYELKARLTPLTVEDQWALAEWCGIQRLTQQRAVHLKQVLTLDPENESAHKGLGHVKRDGRWATHEEHMLAQGYVRYRGRYITPEEKLLLENSREVREFQRAWFDKVKVWAQWLTGRYDAQRQQAVKLLTEIRDPHAIPALKNFLAESPDREIRLLYVQILGEIDDLAALKSLLQMMVLDGDQGIRLRATEKIPPSKMSLAAVELIQYLKHEDNQVVRRAGTALKNLGDSQVVPYLIEALVTNHKYRVPVETPAIGVTRGPGGLISSGMQSPLLPPDLEAGLLTGMISPDAIIPPQGPAPVVQWVTVRVNQQNPEVLEALREITQVDFGYDERTWRLWLMSQKT